jgi:hypothetical protein
MGILSVAHVCSRHVYVYMQCSAPLAWQPLSCAVRSCCVVTDASVFTFSNEKYVSVHFTKQVLQWKCQCYWEISAVKNIRSMSVYQCRPKFYKKMAHCQMCHLTGERTVGYDWRGKHFWNSSTSHKLVLKEFAPTSVFCAENLENFHTQYNQSTVQRHVSAAHGHHQMF